MRDSFYRFASLFPVPLLLVKADGRIVAANPKSLALLGAASEKLTDASLYDVVVEPRETVDAFLRACARSRTLLPGSLTFKAGERGTYRAEGAVLEPASSNEPATILLRLVPKQVSSAKFHLLNAQIDGQAREIARRKQSEAELSEHENHAIQHPVAAADRGGAVVNGHFPAVLREQQRVVRQPDDLPLADHFVDRTFKLFPSSFSDDAKDGRQIDAMRDADHRRPA